MAGEVKKAGRTIELVVMQQLSESTAKPAPDNLWIEPGDNEVSIEETRMRVPGFNPIRDGYAWGFDELYDAQKYELR